MSDPTDRRSELRTMITFCLAFFAAVFFMHYRQTGDRIEFWAAVAMSAVLGGSVIRFLWFNK